ncbi:LRR receptor-like serine threonine-protein kinase [Seminavis robusta]|uniref:LRR receptor-like serine threonine-protein kinase n=1 Tax=Seminavis robusta TaxID=568900 RepID=A0A9N8EQM0_9STRA|nr:LRR receptor-like serine threonine-protein kinase [Seminavis robusta]|eukprot:Sro1685_g291070.1 LRR receptor-like serine threonine-protein kinase (2028) ;mRNA; r:14473-20811
MAPSLGQEPGVILPATNTAEFREKEHQEQIQQEPPISVPQPAARKRRGAALSRAHSQPTSMAPSLDSNPGDISLASKSAEFQDENQQKSLLSLEQPQSAARMRRGAALSRSQGHISLTSFADPEPSAEFQECENQQQDSTSMERPQSPARKRRGAALARTHGQISLETGAEPAGDGELSATALVDSDEFKDEKQQQSPVSMKQPQPGARSRRGAARGVALSRAQSPTLAPIQQPATVQQFNSTSPSTSEESNEENQQESPTSEQPQPVARKRRGAALSRGHTSSLTPIHEPTMERQLSSTSLGKSDEFQGQHADDEFSVPEEQQRAVEETVQKGRGTKSSFSEVSSLTPIPEPTIVQQLDDVAAGKSDEFQELLQQSVTTLESLGKAVEKKRAKLSRPHRPSVLPVHEPGVVRQPSTVAIAAIKMEEVKEENLQEKESSSSSGQEQPVETARQRTRAPRAFTASVLPTYEPCNDSFNDSFLVLPPNHDSWRNPQPTDRAGSDRKAPAIPNKMTVDLNKTDTPQGSETEQMPGQSRIPLSRTMSQNTGSTGPGLVRSARSTRRGLRKHRSDKSPARSKSPSAQKPWVSSRAGADCDNETSMELDDLSRRSKVSGLRRDSGSRDVSKSPIRERGIVSRTKSRADPDNGGVSKSPVRKRGIVARTLSRADPENRDVSRSPVRKRGIVARTFSREDPDNGDVSKSPVRKRGIVARTFSREDPDNGDVSKSPVRKRGIVSRTMSREDDYGFGEETSLELGDLLSNKGKSSRTPLRSRSHSPSRFGPIRSNRGLRKKRKPKASMPQREGIEESSEPMGSESLKEVSSMDSSSYREALPQNGTPETKASQEGTNQARSSLEGPQQAPASLEGPQQDRLAQFDLLLQKHGIARRVVTGHSTPSPSVSRQNSSSRPELRRQEEMLEHSAMTTVQRDASSKPRGRGLRRDASSKSPTRPRLPRQEETVAGKELGTTPAMVIADRSLFAHRSSNFEPQEGDSSERSRGLRRIASSKSPTRPYLSYQKAESANIEQKAMGPALGMPSGERNSFAHRSSHHELERSSSENLRGLRRVASSRSPTSQDLYNEQAEAAEAGKAATKPGMPMAAAASSSFTHMSSQYEIQRDAIKNLRGIRRDASSMSPMPIRPRPLHQKAKSAETGQKATNPAMAKAAAERNRFAHRSSQHELQTDASKKQGGLQRNASSLSPIRRRISPQQAKPAETDQSNISSAMATAENRPSQSALRKESSKKRHGLRRDASSKSPLSSRGSSPEASLGRNSSTMTNISSRRTAFEAKFRNGESSRSNMNVSNSNIQTSVEGQNDSNGATSCAGEEADLESGVGAAAAAATSVTTNGNVDSLVTSQGDSTHAVDMVLDDAAAKTTATECPNCDLTPGAYREDGEGNQVVRNRDLRFSLVGETPHSSQMGSQMNSQLDIESQKSTDGSSVIALRPAADPTEDVAAFRAGLAQAVPVREPSIALADGEQVSSKELQEIAEHEEIKFRRAFCNAVWCTFFGTILAVAVSIFIAIMVINARERKDEEATLTSTPTMAPTPFYFDIPEDTQAAILESHATPQALAYRWLTMDPNLSSYPEWRLRQRFSLATLYFATSTMGITSDVSERSDWKNKEGWLMHDEHECDWYGSRSYIDILELEIRETNPCGDDGEYQRLWLPRNNLRGTIPLELYWLTSLLSLDLRGNMLEGTISSHIGFLSDLEQFALYANLNLTSTLPTEIGLLTHLESIFFGSADFSGTIPSELGLLSSLENLDLSDNNFAGSIPTELQSMTRLVVFYVAGNALTGTIPTQFSSLTSLRYFLVGGNNISGQIPAELSLLSRLFFMYLLDNRLSGTIPSELGLLTALGEMNFGGNYLTGEIPTEIGSWTLLNSLWLSDNFFSGGLPTEIGEMSSLVDVVFRNTPFTGELPSEMGLLEDIEYFLASNCTFNGTMPTEVGQLDSLLVLQLVGNSLTGPLPSEVGLLENLQTLNISSNLLTGRVPSEIGQLSSLTNLYLDSNEFSGGIPAEISLLENLTEFTWSGGGK